MRHLPLLSTPPAISIADEPLDVGAVGSAGDALGSTNGFELVPAWQARPARRLRRLPAVAVPTLAVAVAATLWAARDNDAQVLRDRTAAAQRSINAPTSPLVVQATGPGRAARRSGR